MGNCVGGFSRRTENLPFRRKKPKKTITIAFLGLDGAGKTTILKALQNEDASSVHSTMGFSRGEFAIRKSPIVAFDLGGAPRIRDIWKIYYAEIFAVVYVVDSAAQSRMQENKEVLRTMRGLRQLMGKPILFLLNKKDLPDAVDELQFSEDMDLHNMAIENRTDIRVERVCAVKGVGRDIDPLISEGLEWLLDRVYSRFDQLNQGIEAAELALKERQARERLERQHRLANLSKQHEQDRPGPSTESVDPTTNRDTITIDRSEHSQPNGSIPNEVLDVQNLVSVVPPKKSRVLEEDLMKNEEIYKKNEKGRVNEAFEEEKMETKEEKRESRATKSSSGRETTGMNNLQNNSVKNFKSKVAPNGFVVTDRSQSTTASANFHLFEITSDGRRKPASSPLRRFQSAHFDKDHVFFKPAPKTKLLMQNEPIAPNSDLDRTDLSPNNTSTPGNTEENWSY